MSHGSLQSVPVGLDKLVLHSISLLKYPLTYLEGLVFIKISDMEPLYLFLRKLAISLDHTLSTGGCAVKIPLLT